MILATVLALLSAGAPVDDALLESGPGAASPGSPTETPGQERADAVPLPERAAWGAGLVVTFEELDPVLVERHAMTADGREIVEHLLRTRLLEQMARERGMEVTDADVDRRIAVIDAQVKASGEPGGIGAQLREAGVDPHEFRRLTRMLVIQEALCREALGKPQGARVSNDEQELWIEQELRDRGAVAPPPPWADGIAARCGDVRVTVDEYRAELRTALPEDEVREACYQLAALEGIRARMPDLSETALERAVDLEIERRRRNAEADPKFKGLPYEQLLGMQGFTLESLRQDVAVQVMALSRLWVARTYDDARLREIYEQERELFDGRFGEAVEARVIFLNAAVMTNPLNPRSFDEAAAELDRLAKGIDSEADFETAARTHSEDPRTRNEGGYLGWIRRVGDTNQELRDAVFANLGAYGPPPLEGRVVGPVSVENGVVLLWLGSHRPAPSWEAMRIYVRSELRERFVDDVLSRGELVTFLDA